MEYKLLIITITGLLIFFMYIISTTENFVTTPSKDNNLNEIDKRIKAVQLGW